MKDALGMPIENRTMPSCTIIPVMGYQDVAGAIDWLCKAFGFRERWRAGNHRAQLVFDEGVIALTQQSKVEKGDAGSCPGYSIILRVKDIDKHYEQACKIGARIVSEPADYPYGERQYTVEDIGGHEWTVSESIKDVAPEDWGGTTAR